MKKISDGVFDRSGRIVYKVPTPKGLEPVASGMMATASNLKLAKKKMTLVLYEHQTTGIDYLKWFPNAKVLLDKLGLAASGILLEAVSDSAWKALMETPRAKPLSPNTIRDYKTCLNVHIIPKFGHRKITEITTAELTDWDNGLVSTRGGGRLTLSKRKNVHSMMKRIFSRAVGMEALNIENSWGRFDAMKTSTHAKSQSSSGTVDDLAPFTKAEVNAIVTMGFTDLQESERNMVAFNFGMGLRIGELLALAWEDIDFKNATVRISRQAQPTGYQRCKTGEVRTLDLSEVALAALKAQQEISQSNAKIESTIMENKTDKDGKRIYSTEMIRVVFPNSNGGKPYMHSTLLNRKWGDILNRAGVKFIAAEGRKRTPNQMRNTFASTLLTAGATFAQVARELGNTEEACRKHYARLIEEDRVSTKSLKDGWLS